MNWFAFLAGVAFGLLLAIGLLFGVMLYESRPWRI